MIFDIIEGIGNLFGAIGSFFGNLFKSSSDKDSQKSTDLALANQGTDVAVQDMKETAKYATSKAPEKARRGGVAAPVPAALEHLADLDEPKPVDFNAGFGSGGNASFLKEARAAAREVASDVEGMKDVVQSEKSLATNQRNSKQSTNENLLG
jgi:hypothetical protein